MDPEGGGGSGAARGRGLHLWVVAAWLALAAVAGPARALSPLPFPPELRERLEDVFFAGPGPASPAKLAAFRGRLERRRAEAVAVLSAERRARGQAPARALDKARDEKEVRVYDLLLGPWREGEERDRRAGGGGWLGRLAREPDPVAARLLASRILEVEHALLLSGSLPDSLTLPVNLASISVLDWEVPGFTDPARLEREARNLVDPATGLFLEPADLARLLREGADLSRLDPPADSSFWRDPGAVARRDVEAALTRGGHPVHRGLEIRFPERSAELDRLKKSQTKPKLDVELSVEGPDPEYKLKVGGEIHSEPVTGAFLALLGFNADVTVHVKDFRVELGDVSPEELREQWRSYFEFRRLHLSYRFDDYFRVGRDERGAFAVAREASLTARPGEVVRVGPWPWGAHGNQARREARALGIVSIWLGNTDLKEAENNKLLLREMPDGEVELFHLHHDLGHAFGRVISEQPEAFPWDVGERTRTGRIRFHYHSTWNPSLRKRITWADARWAVRLIAQLTRAQIETAVERGRWPGPVARLLVEKLVNRRNQLVELFEVLGDETPSGPIALLPVDRSLTTGDGRVVDGHLVDGVFEGATQEFDSYWREFLGPVWERARLLGVATFQRTVGLVPSIIFDTDSVGLPRFLELRLLTRLRRDVEENPRPTSERDSYLVRDRMLLGVRAGGGLVASATAAVWRSYTLVQPAGTLAEAHFAGDTVLNVRLPFHRWRGELPRDFVLVRETYADTRVQLTTESLAGSVPPLGAEASVGLERLSRDVLVRRDGRLAAYADVTHRADEEIEAFLNLVFVRLPFAGSDTEQGRLEGRLFELPEAARLGSGPWSDALTRFLRDGETHGLERLLPVTRVRSRFRDGEAWAGVPLFTRRSGRVRVDHVDLERPGPGGRDEHFVQVRHSEGGSWAFLDWGEEHFHTVTALARRAPTGGLEPPRVESVYFQRDRFTKSRELGSGYLDFVNEAGRAHGTLLPFTPSLHSANDQWGHLEVALRAGYAPRALERLLAAQPAALWDALAARLDVDPRRLRRDGERMGVQGKQRLRARSRVPASRRRLVLAARRTADALARARSARDGVERLRALAGALDAASPRHRGSWDGRLLGVLHGLAGPDAVSLEAVIQPPPWIENRLLDGQPLAARTHRRPFRLPRRYLDLRPDCTAGLYRMLEGFAPVPVDDEHVGGICEGARGAFRH